MLVLVALETETDVNVSISVFVPVTDVVDWTTTEYVEVEVE